MLGDYDAAEPAYRRGIVLFHALIASSPDDIATRRALGDAHHRLGVLLKKSNRFVESERMLRDARTLRQQVAAALPNDPDARRDETDSVYQLGTVMARLGRVKEVEKAYTEAVETERALATAYPNRPDYPRKLGRYLNNRGLLLRNTQADPKRAEASFREALALQTPLAERSPTVAGLQWERARTTSNLAATLERTQGYAQAVPVYREAMARLKQLGDDFPSVPDYQNERAVVSFNLAMALTRLSEHLRAKSELDARAMLNEANELLDQASAIYQALTAPDRFPHRPDYRQKLALAARKRGILLSQMGRPTEVEPCFRTAIKTLGELVERYPHVPEYQSELGVAYENLGYLKTNPNPSESQRLLAKAIAHQRIALESNPRDPNVRRLFEEIYTHLEPALMSLKDHEAAAQAAEELVRALPDAPSAALRAASLLGLSAKLAAKDTQLPQGQRDQLQAARADASLQQLHRAVKENHNLPPGIIDHPAFDALRTRSPGEMEALKRVLEAPRSPTDRLTTVSARAAAVESRSIRLSL